MKGTATIFYTPVTLTLISVVGGAVAGKIYLGVQL